MYVNAGMLRLHQRRRLHVNREQQQPVCVPYSTLPNMGTLRREIILAFTRRRKTRPARSCDAPTYSDQSESKLSPRLGNVAVAIACVSAHDSLRHLHSLDRSNAGTFKVVAVHLIIGHGHEMGRNVSTVV